MFKKLLNFIKVTKEEKTSTEEVEIKDKVEEENTTDFDVQTIDENKDAEINLNSKELENNTIEDVIEMKNDKVEDIQLEDQVVVKKQINCEDNINITKEENVTVEIPEEEKQYVKSIKIQREKRIKAIDVYTNDEIIFESYKECSKSLGVPIQYIKENLEYGYTDFFGEAVNFLSKKLKLDVSNKSMGDKNIVEIFNFLHNELWNPDMDEEKREEILCSEKIEPVHMHYKFEIMDDEYDDYYKKYGKIIRRGGKKKIELIDKKNEVIDVFKSLDDCADFFGKNKSEITERLKCGECKIGRYQIRYSLRR
ncbi:NUMOD1 domain protein [Paraclostridium bifermentans]|uniref:NUMOD1 domain protein n=1 Tax=Paraclostridium bifermentans TaxID=1490 RepID=UPI00038C97FA|nr:NUMOD1 domain protein [Paraclostridium bifermentans]EQK47437.1 NUMOD1 domain protein [[Clostridium] bifermentans ATCC 19299] [Paraclostridium bifermentans ATCC 19299]MCE9674516.1 hypothetical protein [Paraclostridium bifermentans]GKZ06481.1 hypothetical protein ANS015_13640 [Paraclostridium bifermentans]GKZ10709.1 hypothetical protein ANS017_20930 [Paraclostridium bifermentans]